MTQTSLPNYLYLHLRIPAALNILASMGEIFGAKKGQLHPNTLTITYTHALRRFCVGWIGLDWVEEGNTWSQRDLISRFHGSLKGEMKESREAEGTWHSIRS